MKRLNLLKLTKEIASFTDDKYIKETYPAIHELLMSKFKSANVDLNKMKKRVV